MLTSLNIWFDHYGYLIIMVVLAAGIIGLPVPDEVVLTFIGYNVSLGKMAYFPALLSVLAGSVVGVTLSYFLGSKIGQPLVKRIGPRIFFTESRFNKMKAVANKFGAYFLFFGYFIPGVRHITSYLAGINEIPFRKFAIFAYTGSLLSSFVFISIGQKLGANWYMISTYAHDYRIQFLLFVIVVSLIGIIFYYRKTSKVKSIDYKYDQ
ncbi:DedA family protein [Bacillus kwashiorkori]|uniref:DedA family protein n=1 Tax=Bacillus kwashiorkori TaxID=1522318 RepID=UPI000782B279|nr:DedA family protein [Bacillus kwashiorkori]